MKTKSAIIGTSINDENKDNNLRQLQMALSDVYYFIMTALPEDHMLCDDDSEENQCDIDEDFVV
jgi:hypothetical protein